VYAKNIGSVAAPTAGFHFTETLLKKIDAMGVKRAFVTLHVGIGTFRPMKGETVDEHVMHSEWAHVPAETRALIAETKKNGGRVIVIGTTAMRALESDIESGFTQIFIKPGFEFKVADGLITNFHLPKSTLIVLVSAFAGREHILAAYKHAIEHNYRFYSFGDAMLII
jgi:S-adenosylmethionine:tRNA ribosyltransferase-isomerase